MEKENKIKTKAIIKLIIWSIFIVVMLLVASKGSNNNFSTTDDNNGEKEKTTLTYQEKLNKLDSNYSYKYFIKLANTEYEFNGSKTEVKEAGNRTIKNSETDTLFLEYFLENGFVYEVKNGGLFQTDIKSIYDKVDNNYLDITFIKECILNKDYMTHDNKYIYNLDNLVITIIVDEFNIKEIIINNNEDYYDLYYDNIGLVKEIKY